VRQRLGELLADGSHCADCFDLHGFGLGGADRRTNRRHTTSRFIGARLYAHDQAAWHATDEMRADLPEPIRSTVSGWVTEEADDGIRVSFINNGADRRVVYQALYKNGAVAAKGQVDLPLSDLQQRLYIARTLAMHSNFAPCSDTYNTVTLPRDSEGLDGSDVDVYLMPGTTDPNAVLFGGFYRVAVDTQANQVRDTHAFTTSCVALTTQTPNAAERTAALGITQIIGDLPTEIHVFQSFTARLPVFVSSRSGIWEVAGADVHLVQGAAPSH